MRKWMPAVALIGLVCIMVLPTPGVLGIAIGTCCVLVIAVSAAMLLFERIFDTVAKPVADAFRKMMRPKKRFLHASSGMARKR